MAILKFSKKRQSSESAMTSGPVPRMPPATNHSSQGQGVLEDLLSYDQEGIGIRKT